MENPPPATTATDRGEAAPPQQHAGRGPWLLAGVAATALAVGLAEVLAWVTGPVGSPLTAVGGVVVDTVPGPVKDAVIAVFGTADKLVLLLAMVAGLALLGAGIGAAQRARRPLGAVLLAVLGLLAVLAVLTRAGAGPADTVPSLVGTGAGALFLGRAGRSAAAGDDASGMDRRRFVRVSAVVAVLGVGAGIAGRWASSAAARIPAARQMLRIPASRVKDPIPPGTELDVAGLDPWVTPADDFYRIDTALAVPRIDVAQWRLRIHGMVDRELEFGFDDLLDRPLVEHVLTLTCVSNQVGGDLVGNAVWTGVPIRELLEQAGVHGDADMVLSTSQDGFTAGTPLGALLDRDRASLLAVGMNGQPLPFEHGYPVRMVVSGLYGYVSATKWLVDLEVTRFDRAEGYWTPRGWSARGPIKSSARIDVPRAGTTVTGDAVVAGVAWAQHTGISAVQVSVDGGSWQDARLGAVTSEDTWRQWALPLPGLALGEHTARARVVDRAGNVQTSERAPVAPDGASGWHERTFRVGRVPPGVRGGGHCGRVSLRPGWPGGAGVGHHAPMTSPPPAPTRSVSDEQRAVLQRRVLAVLATGQILGGLGVGATLALGALLVTEVSGSGALSGMAATMNTLGAALLAIPLARLAQRRGRRISLSCGALVAILGAAVIIAAAVLAALPVLLLGMGLLGAGTALNLQSRFAATDIAAPSSRARDLSLIVWSTTVGSVVGPNLFEPSEVLGRSLGLPAFTGGFVIAMAAQVLGAAVYFLGLRPDPLVLALSLGEDVRNKPGPAGGLALLRRVAPARRAVVIVAFSHAVMVAVMSMTPLHLTEHGATLSLVGLTISLHVAGMYALSPLFGWLADRLGRVTTVLVGQGLFACALLLTWFGAEHRPAVVVALILLGLGWSAATVAGATMVTESVEVHDRPGLQGTSDLLMNLCGAAGGALAGPVLVLIGFSGLGPASLLLVAVATVSALRSRSAPVRAG